jgi:hypothetical protein
MTTTPWNADALALSTWLIGMKIFEGHANRAGLAFIFCYAVRNAVLDELDGIDQTPAEAFASLADGIEPPMPPAAADAFKTMMLKDFNDWLGHLRARAVKDNIDFADYAEALKNDNVKVQIAQMPGDAPQPPESPQRPSGLQSRLRGWFGKK